MKAIRISTLLFTIIIIIIAFDIVRCDKACPHGWYLNEDETACYVKCFTSQLIYSNVYCNFIALKSVDASYDSATNVLSIAPGEAMGGSVNASSIPSCFNVTLGNDLYNVTPDGYIQMAPYLMEIPSRSVINITSSNVTLCYPSSPQLLQCNVSSAPSGSYKIINGTVLRVPGINVTALLGDFYVNEEAIAFFCAQSSPNVSFTQLPRCNTVVLQHTGYLINKDGSMTVLEANVTIKNPLHSINYSQHAIVCFPLSFEYLNCPLKKTVAQYNYKVTSGLTVLDMCYRGLLDPFNYYITVTSQLNTCVDREALLATPIIIQKIYNCFYLLSSFTLIGTLIFRFKMLIRDYHNRCLLCHIVSLLIMYWCFGAQLFYANVEVVSCYILFVANYFFNMAAFFWLNVIAYDSWQFFSRLKTARRMCVECEGCWEMRCGIPLPGKNTPLRFALYSLYSWGLATILTSIILYLDLYVSPFDFSYEVRPYVVPSCYFITANAFLLFISLPLTVTTITNLIFLGLTICVLHRASEGTELVNVRRRRQMFNISMKLFILMGFCWTVDCLTIGFGIIDTSVFQTWFLGVGVTSLQGITISIIYCAPKLCKSF